MPLWSACQQFQPATALVARSPHSSWQQHDMHSISGARCRAGRLQALQSGASWLAPETVSSAWYRRRPLQQREHRSEGHAEAFTPRCSMCHCTSDFAFSRSARRPLCSQRASAGRCPVPTHRRDSFRCASSSMLVQSLSHASGGGGAGWSGGFDGGGGGPSGVAAALAAAPTHDTSAREEVLLLDVGGAFIWPSTCYAVQSAY